MDPLILEDLTVRLDETEPGTLRLLWTGRSTSREPGKILLPFIDEVLGHAEKSGAAVEMRFEKLAHFNSSTIAAVIQMINSAQQRKVRLVLHYDAALRWQALSFEALRRAIRPFSPGSEASSVEFITS